MKFRPCIDILGGAVRQIVGGTLNAEGAVENFVSKRSSADYAELFDRYALTGGHVIMLDPDCEASRYSALEALRMYPGGLQAGGGIDADNARMYLEAGASHVIVTSYVFRAGLVDYERLRRMSDAVEAKHLVLDLSCRRRGDEYVIVTDRWQRYTDEVLSVALMEKLEAYCDEFLVHAVDSEGLRQGVEDAVLSILGRYAGRTVTYAGGIRSFDDIERIRRLGQGRVDFTVGSALDIYGGQLPIAELVARYGI